MMKSTSWMLAVMVMAGCADGAPGTDTTDTADPTGEDESVLRWQLEGLEPLGAGFVYEGWLVVDGSPVSTGRFSVGADGTPSLDTFTLAHGQLQGAEAFVLSVEPETGDDPAPSDVKLLGGDLDATGAATLSVSHGAALGTDFTEALASYILATPTTAAVSDDEDQGIWFLDPEAGPAAAADLPVLPVGWAYEGWVVTADGPISTGTFTEVDMADSDGAGADAGPDGAPGFPGQDFVTPPLVLVGLTAVISVEPVPDDSPAPFVLKPLVDATIDDVGAGVLQTMSNNASATNPAGMVWVETATME